MSGRERDGSAEIMRRNPVGSNALTVASAASNIADAEGVTPPLVAQESGHAGAAFALLESADNLDGRTASANTLLILAAGHRFTEIVRNLLERGANRDVRDTAFLIAARSGSTHFVTLVVEAGAAQKLVTSRYYRVMR